MIDLPINDFFDTVTAFGVPAVYVDPGGNRTQVSVIYQDSHAYTTIEGMSISSDSPIAICRSIDITSKSKGGSIIIDDITYNIVDVKPDGTGVTYLILTVDS